MAQRSLQDVRFNTNAMTTDQRRGAGASFQSPSQAGSVQRMGRSLGEKAELVLPGGDDLIPPKCLV